MTLERRGGGGGGGRSRELIRSETWHIRALCVGRVPLFIKLGGSPKERRGVGGRGLKAVAHGPIICIYR